MSIEVLDAGDVRLEVDGGLAVVTLDRPERRNAMTFAVWRALAAVPELLPQQVRVVLLQGAGAAFCAGLDLRLATPEGVPGEGSLAEIAAGDAETVQARIAQFQAGMTWLREGGAITVAAVQGPAVGAGFQLALAADIRLLGADARFCMREAALGLIPDMTGTRPLVEAVGYSRALEICATARWVDAEEALRLGLASSVVPTRDLAAAARATCDAILAQPAPTVLALKALLREAGGRDLAGQTAAERAAQVPLLRALVDGDP